MSNISVKVCCAISDIADFWTTMDKSVSDIHPSDGQHYTFYQTYVWNKFVEQQYCNSIVYRLGIKKIEYIVAHYNGTPVAVLPVLISRIGKKIEFVSWKIAGTNNMSCVGMPEHDAEKIATDILRFVDSRYPGYRLKLFDVPVASPFSHALKAVFPNISESERSSFHIPLWQWDSYEAYFKSLSSHMRQNIRTLYNHIAKDGLDVRLLVYDKNNLPSRSYLRKVWKLYFLRKAIWRNKKQGVFSGISRRIEVQREMDGMKTKSLYDLDNTRLFCVEINNILTAFMLCYADGHGNIVVPKLAIHPDYQKWSPGSLLIVETLKWCYDHGIRDFDLSRGDEVYKRRFGGIEERIARYSLKR